MQHFLSLLHLPFHLLYHYAHTPNQFQGAIMLTPEEASEIANVSRITILRWLKRHDIGTQLDNGRWEIDPAKLAYLIAVRSAFKGRQVK